jgi:primosomal protein N' (replication factor Y)
MKIATVIPLQKGGTKDELSYFTTKEIEPGQVAVVSLRSKKILGLVVTTEDAGEHKSDIKGFDFNLRKIVEVKENSFFKKDYIDSIILAAKYFAVRKNDLATSLIPAILREEYDKIEKFSNNTIDAKNANTVNLKAEKLLFQTSYDERISYYKTLIRGSFAQKKSVFIVLPTEQDIETFSTELLRGIEKYTLLFHGGVPKKKLLERIEASQNPSHPLLILATAPYLSIPRHDLGTIVLEHESSNAYRTMQRPNIDMRTFVEIFAQKAKAKLIIGDTLLRLETISRKEAEILPSVHALNFRLAYGGEIKILSPSGSPRDKNKFEVLKEESIEEIKRTISKKKNVFIFSLRKGLATMTICRDCSSALYCERCSAPIVLYISEDGKKRMYACNRCRRQLDPMTTCPVCYSWNLFPLGIGTETVTELLKETFADDKKVKIFRIDKESAKNAAAAKEIIKKFESESGAILVGTEMAFFYINKKVPLSLIASFDSLWSIPNFRIGERALAIMLSIIERTESKLIIQTKNKNDEAIMAVEGNNLLPFVRSELADRKLAGYPPYERFIKITHLGDKEATVRAKEMLREILSDYKPEIFSGFVSRLKGKYMTNALLKIEPYKWSMPELLFHSTIDETLLQKLLSLPPNFNITVDPEDLL